MNWPSLTAKRVCCVVFFLSHLILLRICVCTFLFHLIFIVASHLNAHNRILSSFHTNRLPICWRFLHSCNLSRSSTSSLTFVCAFFFQFVDLNFTLIWRDAGQIFCWFFSARFFVHSLFVWLSVCFLINVHKETFVEMKKTRKSENNTILSSTNNERKKKLSRIHTLYGFVFSWT